MKDNLEPKQTVVSMKDIKVNELKSGRKLTSCGTVTTVFITSYFILLYFCYTRMAVKVICSAYRTALYVNQMCVFKDAVHAPVAPPAAQSRSEQSTAGHFHALRVQHKQTYPKYHRQVL